MRETMCKRFYFFVSFVIMSCGYAGPAPEEFAWPWLTGPLLTPSAVAVPKGTYELQPYLFFNVFTGFYDEHWKCYATPNFYQINPQIFGWIGLTENTDISLMLQASYNTTQGVSDGGFGDPALTFDLQLVQDDPHIKWRPAIKLSVTESFPVGKYQRLSPNKYLTDGVGLGTFSTTFNLLFSKIFQLNKHLYWSSILSFSDTISAPVSVHGLSVYRGGKGTKGTIYPGNLFKILYGMEISFTKNWAFAMDIGAFIFAKTRFSGTTKEPAGFPSSVQITLSPALEYNWSNHVGMIFGTWFTVAGRNDNQFASAVGATSIYFQY